MPMSTWMNFAGTSDVPALASKPEPSLAEPKKLRQAGPTVQALGGFRPGS